MLRTDLIDLVNRGDVWAFVGAGTSVDAGGPTWVDSLPRFWPLSPAQRGGIISDARFVAAEKSKDLPRCFLRVRSRQLVAPDLKH